jgi:membrane-bound lytic murein transglycosylase MltF
MALDIEEFEKKLDDILAKETKESLSNWLEDKYWEEIGYRCSVNTYSFWKDLKEQLKKEFILNKR